MKKGGRKGAKRGDISEKKIPQVCCETPGEGGRKGDQKNTNRTGGRL